MAKQGVSVKVDAKQVQARLKATVKNLENPEPFYAQAVKDVRASVLDEFNTQTWRSPSGRIQWADRSFAGLAIANGGLLRQNRDKGQFATGFHARPLLQDSGTLLNAWLGNNANSLLIITKKSVQVGVQGLPYAAVQRGGDSNNPSTAGTDIAVTDKMRMFLGLAKGFWLKKSTDHIHIPGRPHGTPNPELAATLTERARVYSLKEFTA